MLALGGLAPAASATHGGWKPRPTAEIDWRMPALTVDADGNGVIDRYIDGNRTADVPADGRYDVVLDACGSTRTTRYTWWVRALERKAPKPRVQRVTSRACETTVRLSEGRHRVTLVAYGKRGLAWDRTRINVKTHVVLGLGDSYGSGAGAQAVADNPEDVGYFARNCERTPRSHQAVAALELEQSDPRSSVILIHLACAGAQVDEGLLGPLADRAERPQIDESRDLLNDQPVDSLLLSIGGNDTGFGAIVQQCLLGFADQCPTSPFGGFPTLHEYLMAQLEILRNGNPDNPLDALPALAGCLGGDTCRTTEGRGAPLDVKPADVQYTTYPDLSRDDDGAYCDVVPDSLDPGLVNVTSAEWAWVDAIYQALDQTETHTFTGTDGVSVELEQSSPGLNAVIAETAQRYGWAPVTGVYSNSFDAYRGHGYCAGPLDLASGDGRWTLQFLDRTNGPASVPVHPNAGGHRHYSDEILASKD